MSAYTIYYSVIRKIPRGQVATYGQIARLAGRPRHSRQVGYALAALEDDRLPWHRVINAKGEISPRDYPNAVEHQRAKLMKEGVRFDNAGRVSLRHYQWIK
jgi:methylated-DNA-protein-cysteine methyltransferase-like protein